MPIRRRCLVLVALALCLPLLAPPSLRADEQKVAATLPSADGTPFMRFIEDGHGGGRLETAVATYRNDAGQTVRLVAAVHIGEKSYYEGLNDTFRSDDAVLYEMVKPKGMGAPQPHAPAKSGISQFCCGATYLPNLIGDRRAAGVSICSISRARSIALFRSCRFARRAIPILHSQSKFGRAIASSDLAANSRRQKSLSRARCW